MSSVTSGRLPSDDLSIYRYRLGGLDATLQWKDLPKRQVTEEHHDEEPAKMADSEDAVTKNLPKWQERDRSVR